MGIFHQTEVLDGDCGVSFLNDTERENIARSLCQQASSFTHLDENSLKKVINEWDAEELKDIVEHDLESETIQVQTLAMCDLAEALNIEEVPVEAGDLVSPRYLSPRDLCLVNGIDKMAIQEDATADHGDDKNGHETAEDSIKIFHPTSEFNVNGKRRKSVADLKNMFESFSEDPSVEEDLDEKFDLVNGFNKLQNEDLILDQKFDAFFDNVNDNLNEENPLSSFVLKTPSKSQPPLIETESPIKMVLDMITPPPDADMDEEESNVPAAEDKIKPKNKSGKLAKNGKPTTPARKKIGIEKKGDKKTENP